MILHKRRPNAALSLVAVGLLGGCLSLARIVLANPTNLSELVWAEDGLFALCHLRAGVVNCLFEPYNGYAHTWSRMFAAGTSLFPLKWWPVVTNLIAGLSAGIFVSGTFSYLRSANLPLLISLFLSITPIVLPITGIEYANQVPFSNILLPYLAVLLVALPTNTPLYFRFGALILFMTGASTPLIWVILPLMIWQQVRKVLRGHGVWVLWVGALVGSALQIWVMLRSGPHREVALQIYAFNAYLENLWVAIRSLILGDLFGSVLGSELTQEVRFLLGFSAFICILLVASAVFFRAASSGLSQATGLLLVMALVTSLIPSLLIANNLKYFVLFSTLVVAAAVLGLYGRLQGTERSWLPVALGVLLLALWAPSFAASSFRGTPYPAWTKELQRITDVCGDDSTASVQFRFTPDWTDDPSSPSDNLYGVISCERLFNR